VKRVRFFLASEMGTDCEACGARVDLITGGVCVECGRILCARHLHGSRVRRLLVDLGAKSRCVKCRTGARP
jgi:hypothetical protein